MIHHRVLLFVLLCLASAALAGSDDKVSCGLADSVKSDLGPAWIAGPEFQVSPLSPGDRVDPGIVIAAGGQFVVVWSDRRDEGGIFAQRADRRDAPQDAAFQLSTTATALLSAPAIAVGPGDDFVVVWGERYRPETYSSIRGRSFSGHESPMTDEFVIAEATCSSGPWERCDIVADPAIAAQGGLFVAAWTFEHWDVAGGGWSILGQRLDRDGRPHQELFNVDGGRSLFYGNSDVAANSVGNFVVAYDFYYGVNGQAFDSAGERQGYVEVTRMGYLPAVAADSEGQFIVVWSSRHARSSEGEVFQRRLTAAGSPVGEATQVNTYTTGNQYRPAVAVAETGVSLVVWQSKAEPGLEQDGSGSGVFAQFFTSTGAPLADEFQVNVTSQLSQGSPAVASDYDGTFVVVWSSERADGYTDIMARRLAVSDCVSDAVTLCLNQGRFKVQVSWRDYHGNGGPGRAAEMTADAGYFWFFTESNVELVVKVLDGRGLNDHFWVFAAPLTNVELTLTVTDTVSGLTREYFQPSGRVASVTDTRAFPG